MRVRASEGENDRRGEGGKGIPKNVDGLDVGGRVGLPECNIIKRMEREESLMHPLCGLCLV
jgi:hypothetical protein